MLSCAKKVIVVFTKIITVKISELVNSSDVPDVCVAHMEVELATSTAKCFGNGMLRNKTLSLYNILCFQHRYRKEEYQQELLHSTAETRSLHFSEV